MVGRYERSDDNEDRRTGDSRAPNSTQLLELDREENGDTAFDGEGKNEAGGVVGEQIGQVLEEDADEVATINDVRLAFDEEPAAHDRQRLGEEDADKIERVGGCKQEKVGIGRDGQHVLRREDEHAEGVADQSDEDKEKRREEVDT